MKAKALTTVTGTVYRIDLDSEQTEILRKILDCHTNVPEMTESELAFVRSFVETIEIAQEG